MNCKPFIVLCLKTDISKIIEFILDAQTNSNGYMYLSEDIDREELLKEQLYTWIGQQLPLKKLVQIVENFDLWDVRSDGNLLARRYFIGCIVDHFVL